MKKEKKNLFYQGTVFSVSRWNSAFRSPVWILRTCSSSDCSASSIISTKSTDSTILSAFPSFATFSYHNTLSYSNNSNFNDDDDNNDNSTTYTYTGSSTTNMHLCANWNLYRNYSNYSSHC